MVEEETHEAYVTIEIARPEGQMARPFSVDEHAQS